MPGVGEPAPSFVLQAADGETVDSETLRGRPVVLFFFPKASTPG